MKRYLLNIALAVDALWNAILGGNRPLELISSAVGRKAIKGVKWALVAEVAIDSMFELFGAEPGHCRRVAARY